MNDEKLKNTEIEATKLVISQTEVIIDLLQTDIKRLREMLAQQREVLQLLKKIQADK